MSLAKAQIASRIRSGLLSDCFRSTRSDSRSFNSSVSSVSVNMEMSHEKQMPRRTPSPTPSATVSQIVSPCRRFLHALPRGGANSSAAKTARRKMGVVVYLNATRLLITADKGGSHGVRNELWKWSLQQLADASGLEILVCHFPPGTSNWNQVELDVSATPPTTGVAGSLAAASPWCIQSVPSALGRDCGCDSRLSAVSKETNLSEKQLVQSHLRCSTGRGSSHCKTVTDHKPRNVLFVLLRLLTRSFLGSIFNR